MLTAFILVAATQGAKIQSADLKVGKGAAAENGDVLTVLYKGTLNGAKVFDENTDGKNPPFAFKLGEAQVIKGWDQGLKGMKVGGERTLIVPPEFAYGDKGVGDIPPGSTLTFDVTLLRVDKKKDKPEVEIADTSLGTGDPVKDGSVTQVHYKGMFLNGMKFDSSLDHEDKKPLDVTVGQTHLIAGFTSGLRGMRVGGKRKITIPYALAYGEKGRPPVIPPFSTLVFELELVSVKKP